MKQANPRTLGILCVALSAIIFGVMPVFAKLSYAGGANGISLTFYRAALALPFLFFLQKRQGGSGFLPYRWELLPILLSGCFMSVTTLLLYASYNYISVGIATTLHFIYPLVVAGICSLLFRQRLRRFGVLGLVLGCAGISCFLFQPETTSMTGIFLSLTSGVTYAAYIVSVERPVLAKMPVFRLSFLLNIVAAVVSGGYGVITGQLVFHMTPAAWAITCLVALCITLGAFTLLQIGIRRVGAATASMLSLFEPITSVVCAMVFFSDTLSWPKAAGCLLIFAGLFCTLKNTKVAPARGDAGAAADAQGTR